MKTKTLLLILGAVGLWLYVRGKKTAPVQGSAINPSQPGAPARPGWTYGAQP